MVGVGVEYALSPNWTVGAEFLHTMYADSGAPVLNANGSSNCSGSANTANCVIRNNITTDVARLRVNFKLN